MYDKVCKPLSVQSESKFFKTSITRQQKSVKKKIMHQNHAIANNDNNSDETYSPKMKKRHSSKFIFTSILYSFYKFIK
jgi:hypothetical protein